MKAPQPPAAATWLLEHLIPPAIREPLVGDLVENYARHPSAVWYWRQVIGAILVSLVTKVNTRFNITSVALFAMAVCALLPHPGSWLFWGINLPWPLSFFTEVALLCIPQASIVVGSLLLYRLINRNVRVRWLLSASLVSLTVLCLGNLVLWTSLPVAHLHYHAAFNVIWRLPLFVALVLALRLATPRSQDAEASFSRV